MTLQETISQHLRLSGESMRALSLRANLGEKFVADIICGKSRRPSSESLAALSDAIGADLAAIPIAPADTYSDLLAQLAAMPPDGWSVDRVGQVVSKIRAFLRRMRWDPATTAVSRAKVVAAFAAASPAEFELSKGSFATFKSLVLAGIDAHQRRGRERDISDIRGPYRDLHLAIANSDFPQDLKLAGGPFFTYAHDRGLPMSAISTEVLEAYFATRMAQESKLERKQKKHVKRVASLLNRVAGDPAFAAFGIMQVVHPFADGRDKFGVAAELLSPLLDEFDGSVAPWAQGKASRDGLTRSELIARLDAEAPVSVGKPRLAGDAMFAPGLARLPPDWRPSFERVITVHLAGARKRTATVHWSKDRIRSVIASLGAWDEYCRKTKVSPKPTGAGFENYADALAQSGAAAVTIVAYLERILAGHRAVITPGWDSLACRLVIDDWTGRSENEAARKAKTQRIVGASTLYQLGLDMIEEARDARFIGLHTARLFRNGLLLAVGVSLPQRAERFHIWSLARRSFSSPTIRSESSFPDKHSSGARRENSPENPTRARSATRHCGRRSTTTAKSTGRSTTTPIGSGRRNCHARKGSRRSKSVASAAT